MYAYKDFITGKLRHTRGTFRGFTEQTGVLSVKYAIFQNPRGSLLVPEYLLSKETKELLRMESEK